MFKIGSLTFVERPFVPARALRLLLDLEPPPMLILSSD